MNFALEYLLEICPSDIIFTKPYRLLCSKSKLKQTCSFKATTISPDLNLADAVDALFCFLSCPILFPSFFSVIFFSFIIPFMFQFFFSLPQNLGTCDAIGKMIHYEGFAGFYKGMNTKIVQSVLAAAVLFMVKEELVRGVRLLLSKKVTNTVR